MSVSVWGTSERLDKVKVFGGIVCESGRSECGWGFEHMFSVCLLCYMVNILRAHLFRKCAFILDSKHMCDNLFAHFMLVFDVND